jgi:hypothetical protein
MHVPAACALLPPLRKEATKFQIKNKKAETTVGNLKKKLKQGTQALKTKDKDISRKDEEMKTLQKKLMAFLAI